MALSLHLWITLTFRSLFVENFRQRISVVFAADAFAGILLLAFALGQQPAKRCRIWSDHCQSPVYRRPAMYIARSPTSAAIVNRAASAFIT
ncbi:hypothetical protein KCP74_06590 [Salmonella enterica subsp. enterica]|nr:hypothetical protein KCP74_06590 [Salmonella enterica subsp. enterica]